jgi:hypothetical protein
MLRPGILIAAAAALTLPASADAAPGWTAPQPVGSPWSNVSSLDATMSAGGHVAVAWAGDDSPARGAFRTQAVIATKAPGRGFDVAPRDGAYEVDVDSDAGGAVHRAWSTPSGVWLDDEQVTAADADPIALDVSPNGTAIVAWRTGDHAIHARIRPAGGTLGPVQTLVAGGADHPKVAVADSGEAIAVWQTAASPWRLRYKVRPAGGTFAATATDIGTATTTPREADLAMNARGDAQLVYVNNPGGGAIQFGAAHRRAGGAFTERPDLSGPQSSFEAGVAAIAPDGDGLVAYVGDDARVVVRTGDAYDATPDPLAADGRRISATYDGRGNAYVAWVDTSAADHVLRAARRAAGQPTRPATRCWPGTRGTGPGPRSASRAGTGRRR